MTEDYWDGDPPAALDPTPLASGRHPAPDLSPEWTTKQAPGTTAAAELEGMRLVSDGGEPWATRLGKEPPPHVARACGALGVVTGSRIQALKAAYTLDDAGLLVDQERRAS